MRKTAMKVKYQTANARLTFEFESDNDKALVAELARIQEVFTEETCGCCKSERVRFDVREFDGNHYYKLLCDDCGATRDFGQHKNGKTLFVKRFEKDTREPLPHRGWYQYGKSPDQSPTKPSGTSGPITPKPTKPAESTPATGNAAPPDRAAADVAKAIDGMNNAGTLDNLEAWSAWAKKIADLSIVQREKLQEGYRLSIERLAKPPARRTS
jgi:hypothetical protein